MTVAKLDTYRAPALAGPQHHLTRGLWRSRSGDGVPVVADMRRSVAVHCRPCCS